MGEPQVQKKELLEEEIDISFFIQLVRVEGNYDAYYKLYTAIKDAKSENEINFSYLSPEERSVNSILKDIEKLYNVYKFAGNEKLTQGAREEILKLISLLIWNIYH